MLREGSSEKNLAELLPLVTDGSYHRCMLVCDDRSALDLLNEGEVDHALRRAIELGLNPLRAFQLVTLMPARYFHLEGLGGIAPGYWADCFSFADLEAPHAEQVFFRGRLVAREGRALFQQPLSAAPALLKTFKIKPFTSADLRIPAQVGQTFPVIEIVPHQIVTRRLDERPPVVAGAVVADVSRDLLKLVVVERHRATGNIGRGLVRGFGLRRGALATSVAHDSHNVVVVGADDDSIALAVRTVAEDEGGLAVVADGAVLGRLPLPVMGLLSLQPLEEVARLLDELEQQARMLGCSVPAPFAVLSFLALPVIPELKLTDRGLVDARAVQLLEVP